VTRDLSSQLLGVERKKFEGFELRLQRGEEDLVYGRFDFGGRSVGLWLLLGQRRPTPLGSTGPHDASHQPTKQSPHTQSHNQKHILICEPIILFIHPATHNYHRSHHYPKTPKILFPLSGPFHALLVYRSGLKKKQVV
jgi:hypothetical protein